MKVIEVIIVKVCVIVNKMSMEWIRKRNGENVVVVAHSTVFTHQWIPAFAGMERGNTPPWDCFEYFVISQ